MSKNKKNSLALIIQVRNSSTRLPYKVMKNLCGKPMIVRILERVKRVKSIEKIILTTTNRKEDDIFLNIAKENKVNFFRGSKNDVVDRYYRAAKKFNVSQIVRLPGDNAIPEPLEYDKIIAYHLKSKNDFSSNIANFMDNGYPGGIGVEIFTFKSLQKIWRNEKRKKYREHVALNYYDYANDKINEKFNFKVGTIKCPKYISRPDLLFDVNYQKDYLFIKKIYEHFYSEYKFFTIRDVINWLDKFYIRNKCIFERK